LEDPEGSPQHKEALRLMEEKKSEVVKIEMEKEMERLQSARGHPARTKSSSELVPVQIAPTPSFSSSCSSSTTTLSNLAGSYAFSYSTAIFSARFTRLTAVATAFPFQLIYWMICFNIPFQTFFPITDLLNKSRLTGLCRFVSHTSSYAFNVFLRILFVAVRMWLMIGFHGIGEYSIIMDESTTTANVSIILFYLCYRKFNGRIVQQYLGLRVIGKNGASASALKLHLLEILFENGLDPRRMRGFGSD
jgi:hypothetical protein